MNRELHCFNFDMLVDLDYKIRIIDIDRPEKTILNIDKYEFQLIQNGVYISHDLKLKYNGKTYYISKALFDKIQRKRRTPLENLGISLSSLYKEDELKETKIKILMNNIRHLKGRKDVDIILFLDKSNRKTYKDVLNKVRKELLKDNLGMFKVYFLSDKIITRTNQKIILRKSEILIEHLLGLKIEGNAFVSLQQDKYDKIFYYDNDNYVISSLKNNISEVFNFFYKNSADELRNIIEKRLNKNDLRIELNLSSENETNRFQKTLVYLDEQIRENLKIISFDKF